jgi:hypothetical protein
LSSAEICDRSPAYAKAPLEGPHRRHDNKATMPALRATRMT